MAPTESLIPSPKLYSDITLSSIHHTQLHMELLRYVNILWCFRIFTVCLCVLYVYLTYPYNIPLPAPNTPNATELVAVDIVEAFSERSGSIALLVRELCNCFECVYKKKKIEFLHFFETGLFRCFIDEYDMYILYRCYWVVSEY